MISLPEGWAFLSALKTGKLPSFFLTGVKHGYRRKEWKRWMGPSTLVVATVGGACWWMDLIAILTINATTIFLITRIFLKRTVFKPILSSIHLVARSWIR